MPALVKVGSVAVGLGCFAAAYFFPEYSDLLAEAGVGMLVLAGVATRVLHRGK